MVGRRAALHAMREGCDTLLINTWSCCWLLPSRFQGRCVVYGDIAPPDADRLYFGETNLNARKRFMARRFKRMAETGRVVFAGLSPWCSDNLQTHYGLPQGSTAVVRPPIDLEYWKPTETPKRSDRFDISFVGGQFERKGGPLLLEIAKDPRLSGCHWHLVTSHPGSSTDNVTFYNGLTPDTDSLREIVRSSHLFVLPTKLDCSSLASVEAGAVGVPVVVSNVGGIGDIVETDVNGRLLQSQDPEELIQAILHYRRHDEQRARHGETGRQRAVERNSLQRHLDDFMNLLKG